MNKILFLVGQYRLNEDGKEYNDNWEVQGIFDGIDIAMEACRGHAFFVLAIRLNEESPLERIDPEPSRTFYPGKEKIIPKEFLDRWVNIDS